MKTEAEALKEQNVGNFFNFLLGTFLLFGFGTSIVTGIYYGGTMVPIWIYRLAFGLIILSFLYDMVTNFKVNHFAMYPLVIVFYIGVTSMLAFVENTSIAPYFKDIATTENFFDFMKYGFQHLTDNSQDFNWILPWAICVLLLYMVILIPFKIVQNFIIAKFFTNKQAV